MRHVRTSERQVCNEIYETLADLKGIGLSANEASQALIKVANNLFERTWKLNNECSDTFDIDTLPHSKNVCIADELITTKSLACVAEEIEKESNAGRMITHAADSTTKR